MIIAISIIALIVFCCVALLISAFVMVIKRRQDQADNKISEEVESEN